MKETQSHRCWAEIELEALRHNAQLARRLLGPNVALLAVIKANGYGHGLAPVADALRTEAEMFAVANLREALEARRIVPHPILLMGPALAEERRGIVEHGFIPAISSSGEAREFSRVAGGSSVSLNCKIDTGMGRMGIQEETALSQIREIAQLPNVKIHSISTHLPSADDDAAYTRAQLARFRELTVKLRREVPGDYKIHVLPSGGVRGFADSGYDLVRAGLMLYGSSPNPELQKLLRPAMTLKARVALVREVAPGSSVSYARTFTAQRATRVATLSIGYADGVRRAVSNRGLVLIRGQRFPIIGRVTMDLTMVDVTDVPAVEEGDEVVLIGKQGEQEILATEVAEHASTIAWEIFTGIGARVARIYIDNIRSA